MKNLLISALIASCLFLPMAIQAQKLPSDVTDSVPDKQKVHRRNRVAQKEHETDSLLSNAYRKDQDARWKLIELTQKLQSGSQDNTVIDSLFLISEQMKRIDRENIGLVTRLLKKGFPESLSSRSYKTIWLILDHADIRKQNRYLPFIEKAVSKGLIPLSNLAILTDRMALYRKKAQIYGTQAYTLQIEGIQRTYIWPVENPDEIDQLRKRMGLGSLKEYMEILRATSGQEVFYDPKLTVKDLLSLSSMKSRNKKTQAIRKSLPSPYYPLSEKR